jgi:hypothetical protein
LVAAVVVAAYSVQIARALIIPQPRVATRNVIFIAAAAAQLYMVHFIKKIKDQSSYRG